MAAPTAAYGSSLPQSCRTGAAPLADMLLMIGREANQVHDFFFKFEGSRLVERVGIPVEVSLRPPVRHKVSLPVVHAHRRREIYTVGLVFACANDAECYAIEPRKAEKSPSFGSVCNKARKCRAVRADTLSSEYRARPDIGQSLGSQVLPSVHFVHTFFLRPSDRSATAAFHQIKPFSPTSSGCRKRPSIATLTNV